MAALALDDLPYEVLLELRVIGASDTPLDIDQQAILKEYAWWRAEAARDWNITWDADDDIPEDAAKGVILLMAERVAPGYAKPRSLERQSDGEGKLRLAIRRKPTYEPPQGVDYF
jgi:hypothetical protein